MRLILSRHTFVLFGILSLTLLIGLTCLPIISGSHAHETGLSSSELVRGTTTPTPTPADVIVETSPEAAPPDNAQGELTINEALDLGLGSKDFDCDGISNRFDNCPLVFNPKQEDKNKNKNKNGIGDACEPGLENHKKVDSRCDSDGDGIIDSKDNCILVCNRKQEDKNKNGIGDACDPKILGTKPQPIQKCSNKRRHRSSKRN